MYGTSLYIYKYKDIIISYIYTYVIWALFIFLNEDVSSFFLLFDEQLRDVQSAIVRRQQQKPTHAYMYNNNIVHNAFSPKYRRVLAPFPIVVRV